MSLFKIQLDYTENLAELSISNLKINQKKWLGCLAELIYSKALELATLKNINSNIGVSLNKEQLQMLFIKMTQIQQYASFKLNVAQDLSLLKEDKKCYQVLKSLLLFIRMNSIHIKFEQMQKFYYEEFCSYDDCLLNGYLSILKEQNLIQKIELSCGCVFFDKNVSPHNHIYFKKQNRLMDCNNDCFEILCLDQENPYFKLISKKSY